MSSFAQAVSDAQLAPGRVKISDGPDQYADPMRLDRKLKQMRVGNTKLYDKLEARNPAYDSNLREWIRNADLALNRIDAANKKEYLVKGKIEDDNLYALRCDLAEYLPETPAMLNDFLGAVFGQSITRDAASMKAFLDCATLDKRPMDDLSRDAALYALIYGVVDAVADLPARGGTMPYLALYTPEFRTDWQVDDNGDPVYVKYKYCNRSRPTWDADDEAWDEYRIIDAECYRIYRVLQNDHDRIECWTPQDNGSWVKIESGESEIADHPCVEHKFGRVPVTPLYWRKRAPFLGDAWVKGLVSADLKVFRMESDLGFDLYMHGHGPLKTWLNNTKNADGTVTDARRAIGLGAGSTIPLDPGGEDREKEDVAYLEWGTAPAEVQAHIIDAHRQMIRRMTGNAEADMNATYSGPESGVAIAYRDAQRSKNYRTLAKNLQTWESDALDLVGAISGGGSKITITYPTVYDQRSIEDSDKDLDVAYKLGSETLVKEHAQRVAAKILGDGVDEWIKNKVRDEINKAAVKLNTANEETPGGKAAQNQEV